jgi:G3E family GTPase
MANPARIIETLERYANNLERIVVLSVVDLERIDLLLEAAAPLVGSQLGAADLIALNKNDLAPGRSATLREDIARMNPGGEIIDVCGIKDDGIFNLAERLEVLWSRS